MTMSPAAVKVKLAATMMSGRMVSVLPAVAEPMVASPDSVMGVEIVPLPLVLLMAPTPPRPAPVMVIGSGLE